MVLVPFDPWVIVRLAGDAARTKLGVLEVPGQLLTRLVALSVPMPVAKSHPTFVP